MSELWRSVLNEHLDRVSDALTRFRAAGSLLERWGADLAALLGGGGRLLIAGNGGSAATAEHLAAELVGRMRDERAPLSAIALSAGSATVTAVANDYGFAEIFARQVRAHGRPGDILLLFSTSGRSSNLVAAAEAARRQGLLTWAVLGTSAGDLTGTCDEMLHCPSADSQVVQELQLIAAHVLCEHIDRALLAASDEPVGSMPARRSDQTDLAVQASPGSAAPSGQLELVVVGDTVLDRDIGGVVGRMVPDAPALVLDERSVVERPGGAGLTAMLAADRGHDVTLITGIAADDAGRRLTAMLAAAGIHVVTVDVPGPTPEKIRMLSGQTVLLRLDRGGTAIADGPWSGEPQDAVLDVLQRADAVVVSDYGRGIAAQPGIRAALARTPAAVVWDPHPHGSVPIAGVALITPNLAEAGRFAGTSGAGPQAAVAQRAAEVLLQRWQAGAVAVTTGAGGAVLCRAGLTPLVIPASPADGDSCGAGDLFAATAALCLARGDLVTEAVQKAVQAATAYVAGGGATATVLPLPVSPADPPSDSREGTEQARTATAVAAGVRARGGTVVAAGGCFDLLHAGHLATLQAARNLGDCLIVCLNSDASVRAIKGPDRPVTAQQDRAALLAALSCVDAVVVFDEPTPEAVLSLLRPDVWVKGGDYDNLPESHLLGQWGGQAVTVPYVAGRSTTSIIAVGGRDGSQSPEGSM